MTPRSAASAGRRTASLRILGFDAAGTVVAIGSEVSRFAAGDDVLYAGVTNRPGSNAEFQLVDERIVGRKPATLDFAQAASLPLTTITAWESLFDHLALGPESTGAILVVGAAGGAGSMATQLARTQTRLEVVATASRPGIRRLRCRTRTSTTRTCPSTVGPISRLWSRHTSSVAPVSRLIRVR